MTWIGDLEDALAKFEQSESLGDLFLCLYDIPEGSMIQYGRIRALICDYWAKAIET